MAEGFDNNGDKDFYSISFASGLATEYIETIVYTLPFGVFDTTSGITAPAVSLPSLNGLGVLDISFDPDVPTGTNGPVLTITFAAGTFGVGDSFRFGFDVDGLGTIPASGEDFGIASVPVDVTLESGASGTGTFTLVQDNFGPGGPVPKSIAQVVVPTPASAALLGFGGLVIARRRR